MEAKEIQMLKILLLSNQEHLPLVTPRKQMVWQNKLSLWIEIITIFSWQVAAQVLTREH